MLHPASRVAFISPQVGHGAVATEFIPAGTIVWVRDALDQTLTGAQVMRMPAALQRQLKIYSYRDRAGARVLCWDHARFLNHSCQPNCLSPGWEFEIAVRDIEPGEQFTDDYGSLNLEEVLMCSCGHERCRGRVGPGDFEPQIDDWDRALSVAMALIPSVSQPLWELLEDPQEVLDVAAGVRPLRSAGEHLWSAVDPAVLRKPRTAARSPR